MTAVQFNYFAKNRLETSSDGMVNYKALFDEFKDVQLLVSGRCIEYWIKLLLKYY